jgi:hypothetical protein
MTDLVDIELITRNAGDPPSRRVTVAPETDDGWHRQYAVRIPEASGTASLTVRILLPPGEGFVLATNRTFRPLTTRAVASHLVGTFLITSGQQLWRWALPCVVPMEYRFSGRRTMVIATILSHTACGLTAWGVGKLERPSSDHVLRFSADRLNRMSECIWFEPFPAGAKGVLCITDHADFDSVEKLRILAPLVRDTGLRFTKSVFPHSDPHPTRRDKAEPGLDDPAYYREIRQLYELGVEIAYHGFSPRTQAPPLDDCKQRCELMNQFSPETWIDHGTGDYLFSRKALLDGTSLVSFLNARGIRNYWSYFDVWDNPWTDLNSWRPSGPGRLIEETLQFVTHISRTSAPSIRHRARHLTANVLGSDGYRALAARKLRRASYDINRLWSLRSRPQLLYGSDGLQLLFAPSDTVIFDTTLLNHLALQTSPYLLDRLAADSGVCIAHTYLGWKPQFASNVFTQRNDGTLQLAQSFRENMEHASRLQKRRDLITLPFSFLRKSLAAFSNARMMRTARGWRIKSNPSVWIGIPDGYPAGVNTTTLPDGRRVSYCSAETCDFLPLPDGGSRGG